MSGDSVKILGNRLISERLFNDEILAHKAAGGLVRLTIPVGYGKEAALRSLERIREQIEQADDLGCSDAATLVVDNEFEWCMVGEVAEPVIWGWE